MRVKIELKNGERSGPYNPSAACHVVRNAILHEQSIAIEVIGTRKEWITFLGEQTRTSLLVRAGRSIE